jgi:hypothetical protein
MTERIRHPYSKQEDEAIEEALATYGKKWRQIEHAYGPAGNGKLRFRVTNNRIRSRAYAILQQRQDSKTALGSFSCLLPQETQEVKPFPPNVPDEWTVEQDEALIQGFAKHGHHWARIRDESRFETSLHFHTLS